MKNVLLIGIWCFFAGTLWSQQADTLNRSDENGKQGHWVFYGADRPESGIPPEGKVEEGNYVNDRKEGMWIKYHDDGVTPKLKGEYENNRPKGNYWKYDRSGHLKDSGTFEKNQYHDSLRRGGHYSTYPIDYVVTYNQFEKEEGTVRHYYSSGQLEFVCKFHNCIPYDTAYRYFENGDLKELIVYGEEGRIVSTQQYQMKNPPFVGQTSHSQTEFAPSVGSSPRTRGIKWQREGYNKVYNEDDEIWQDGIFKEGKLQDGKVYVYDRDGILLKVNIYKNGVYHSEGQL